MKKIILATITATTLISATESCDLKLQSAIQELKEFKQQNSQHSGLLYKDSEKLKKYIVKLKDLNDKINILKTNCK